MLDSRWIHQWWRPRTHIIEEIKNDSLLEDLLGKIRSYKLKKEGEVILLKHIIDEAVFLLREILTFGVQTGCCDNLDMTEESYPLLQPGALEDTKLKIEKFLAFVEKKSVSLP